MSIYPGLLIDKLDIEININQNLFSELNPYLLNCFRNYLNKIYKTC